MLTPPQRAQLAQDICTRLTIEYPAEIVLAGVFGSTARGTDTPWSDLEMTFVVRSGSSLRDNHFLYRDVAVGYYAIEQHTLELRLADPSIEEGAHWPFWMGMLSVLKVLYGDPALITYWLGLGQSAPPEKFRAALVARLPELVTESYGRILSCRERGTTTDLQPAVWEVLLEMNWALCMLNQRWVTHDYYQGLVDAFSFPKLPRDYASLVPALWNASDIDQIVPLAERLVQNFWQLITDEDIPVANYQSISEVPLP